jgi:hypothetical protein
MLPGIFANFYQNHSPFLRKSIQTLELAGHIAKNIV